MYQFVICEDDAQQRDHLQKLIKKTYGGQPVFCYDDVDTLLEELPHIPAPRIIFMDIVLKTRIRHRGGRKDRPGRYGHHLHHRISGQGGRYLRSAAHLFHL